MQLGEADVREIATAAERCLSARTLDGFVDAVLTSCHRLLDCDLVTYNEVDLGTPEVNYREEPGDTFSPELLAAFLYHLDDHPVISQMRRSGSGAAMRISDVVSSREFRNRGIYVDFFHQLGLEDQVAISLRASATRIIGVAANRDRAFTTNERDRLEMLRPILASAYRNVSRLVELERAIEHLQMGLSSAGCDVFMLSVGGSVVECTGGALRRLAEALPPGTEESERAFLSRLAGETRKVRWEAAGARWLAASTCVDTGTIVTIRSEGPPPVAVLKASLGISDREAQVLSLLVQGQDGAEVAGSLGVSVRTVHKHLEHLYRGLGVSSRSEAVAIARSITETILSDG